MLMVDGVERIGANLHNVMEKARSLEEAVIFIDEFEEIAGNRMKQQGLTNPLRTSF